MRIGIDLQVLGQRRTGIGNYAFNLVRSLAELNSGHEFVLFVPKSVILNLIQDPVWIPDHVRNDKQIKFVELPKKRWPFWTAHVRYARIMRKEKLDVLHGVANTIPLFYPSRDLSPAGYGRPLPSSGESNKVRLVVTIHDLAIYRHPEWFPRGQWLATKLVVPQSIKKADKIIVPSLTTKQDLMELFQVRGEKIAVIPEGVEERFFKSTPSSSPPYQGGESRGKYILFVGTIEPRKNLKCLIEAYERLPEKMRKEYELWVVGHNAPFPSYLKRGVRFFGYVDDEKLPGLYQNATLFVYPSLYEGFGLPVLEAMAGGCPTICSKQIVGNFKFQISNDKPDPIAAVDAYSVDEIRGAMERVLTDEKLRREIGEKGVEQARKFSWEDTARRTLEVYESI